MLDRGLRAARSIRRSVRSQLVERRLLRSRDAVVRAVGGALRTARTSDFGPAATARLERIEGYRAELAACDERIELAGAEREAIVGPLSVTASLPAARGRQLHAIVAAIGARRGLELGTCFGISAAYQASALSTGPDSVFVTCEGWPPFADRAIRGLDHLGLGWGRVVVGRFEDTLAAVLSDVAPIDWAFIDGHHEEFATQRYFDQIRRHAAERAVLAFDDIRWSAGMSRAWAAISSDPSVVAAADVGRIGIVVVRGGRS